MIDKQSFNEAMELAKKGIAFDIERELKLIAPVDKGTLRNLIDFEIVDGNIVFNFVGYAKYVEFGTPPHIIKPKDKKALFWKGAEHPVKSVNHPGTAPQPFIRNTFRRKLIEIAKRNISKHTFKVILNG